MCTQLIKLLIVSIEKQGAVPFETAPFVYSRGRIDPLFYFFFFAVGLVFFAVELVFFEVELVFFAVELVFFAVVLVVFAGSFGFSSGMASTPYS